MRSSRKADRAAGLKKSAITVAHHLQRMSPALRATVEATRKAVKAAAPEAIEVAYQTQPPRSKSAWWKIARYLVGDAEVAGISTFSRRANLFFYRGAEIDDDSGTMEGSGSAMRSIRLSAPLDATRPAVRRILRRAFQLASVTHPKQGPKRDAAIDEYLKKVSARNRGLLRDLRRTIRAAVPGVEECISYRIPAFRFEGRIIAGFSATSTGCSYYPFSGTTLKTLAADIESYSQTKSALHFNEPLPVGLVRKLLKARIAEGVLRSREPIRSGQKSRRAPSAG